MYKEMFNNFDYSIAQAIAILHDYDFQYEDILININDEKFDELTIMLSEEVSSFENLYIFENDFEHYQDLIDDFLDKNNLN